MCFVFLSHSNGQILTFYFSGPQVDTREPSQAASRLLILSLFHRIFYINFTFKLMGRCSKVCNLSVVYRFVFVLPFTNIRAVVKVTQIVFFATCTGSILNLQHARE